VAHTGARGYGIRVAILDTGIDMDHPVLASRILPGSRDFLDNDNDPSDVPDGIDNDGDGYIDEATGHGTHVAGLVVLVAPSARILALRVLDSDGIGNVYSVAAAIEYAVTRGARIINLSIGLTAPSAVVDQAIQYAYGQGVILVTAAGNRPNGPNDFPAISPSVWAIAAVDAGDMPASFSSAFPAVVLSAPGVNLESTYWNGGYAVWSGTSMAAPLVSGAAALVLSRNPSLKRQEVKEWLQSSARPFMTSTYGMGAGILNPGAAVGASPVDVLPNREQARY
jgi:subtilisin family serine protease